MRTRADMLARGDEVVLDGQVWTVLDVRVTPILVILQVAPGWWVTLERGYLVCPAAPASSPMSSRRGADSTYDFIASP